MPSQVLLASTCEVSVHAGPKAKAQQWARHGPGDGSGKAGAVESSSWVQLRTSPISFAFLCMYLFFFCTNSCKIQLKGVNCSGLVMLSCIYLLYAKTLSNGSFLHERFTTYYCKNSSASIFHYTYQNVKHQQSLLLGILEESA